MSLVDNPHTLCRRAALALAAAAAALLSACSGVTPTREVRRVDSLNTLADRWSYRNIDSSYHYASAACDAAAHYGDGRAEACNQMAFTLFQRMDFDAATEQFAAVHRLTQNELELLLADVGMMAVCQRTAANRDFYSHRNSAINRMKRIDEDRSLFSDVRDKVRLSRAYAEFHLVSARYYYGLRQRQEALAELACIDADALARNDAGQYMRYLCMKGRAGMGDATAAADERRHAEMDNLRRACRLAADSGYVCVYADALPGLMDAATDSADVAMTDEAIGALLSCREYPYGQASALIAAAARLNESGRYTEACDTLRRALTATRVPELLMSAHEQLSVAYAGMDMKQESDLSRNAYLDLLNVTRQDRELESRYAELAAESHKLTVILIVAIVIFVLAMLMMVMLARSARRRSRQYLDKLRHALAECSEEWASRNEQTNDLLTEERERLEAERYISEKHIDENKRRNIIRRSCLSLVSGITPYIDRMINEVGKLIDKDYISNETLKHEKYKYICELADVINEQNEILSLWIKMRRGEIQLSVENFGLNDLFSLLQKGRRSFDIKRQTLVVEPTDSVVRADRALTLFMINTLVENARKYTPEGGRIRVWSTQTDGYVEVSVEDNGIGLSAEDVATILDSKVYDSRTIGTKDDAHREYLAANKGGGFGLMNCKGIIEKYRKSNQLFSVCCFGIESRQGEGSRFYFRLPVGVMKRLAVVVAFVGSMLALGSCGRGAADASACSYASATDSAYTLMLDSASAYADSVYYANVDHRYTDAMDYAAKAVGLLNRHYLKYSADATHRLMNLSADDDMPAEFAWWNSDFDTDYHVILDIRNEVAVACLALKDMRGYRYNNEAYAGMYKLQGKDTTLESYCSELERQSESKLIGVSMCVLLVLVSVVLFYFQFIRKRIREVFNQQQLLEINKRAFAASQRADNATDEEQQRSDNAAGEALQMAENTLHDVPQRIVDETFESVRDLLDIETLGMAVSVSGRTPLYVASSVTGDTGMPQLVARCLDEQKMLAEGPSVAIPMMAEADEALCVGAMYVRFYDGIIDEASTLTAELVAKYYARVVYNAVICPAVQYGDIEAAHEEARRASWEDGLLHVQNLVLDNCMSTIKHETIYYPSRIKRILTTLEESALPLVEEKRQLEDVRELVEYYKGIFALLYQCASRQLDEVTFRRTTISVAELTDYCSAYMKRRSKGSTAAISFSAEAIDAAVTGDRISLRFLMENLVDEALRCKAPGRISLTTRTDGAYIRFSFTDYRRTRSREELNKLFTPELQRMTSAADGELADTEYLVCKQIIREHDEYAGRRGCRINAEPAAGADGGFTVYFTIPAAKK